MLNKYIRNFSIIAHIDHGKSTLADRFIEICNNLDRTKIKDQMLDSMDLEREKGITIKAQCVTLNYQINQINYKLNLIDTPGHSDFSYEVSKSLTACDGVVLLIDITQGIEAQTIFNYQKAKEKNLIVIPVLNKIDLNRACSDSIKDDISKIVKNDKIISISAKTGLGVKDLITEIINKIPHPPGNKDSKLEALIIDSWFNTYTGIICLINIKSGIIRKDDKIITLSNNKLYKVIDLGIFIPQKFHKTILEAGEIGYIAIKSKNLEEIKVGDIITSVLDPIQNRKVIINKVKPSIFANVYPSSSEKFVSLKESLAKLSLNDPSISYSLYNSNILGFGFRCGFLGPLHLDVTRERLKREYALDTIITPPNVIFKAIKKDATILYINNPSDIISVNDFLEIQEPIALVIISAPSKYIDKIVNLCKDKRGIKKELIYTEKSVIKYYMPLDEIISDFSSRLQTISNGFASMYYEFFDYLKADLVKLNTLINGKTVDALEFIVHQDDSYRKAKNLVEQLIIIIPKQLFEIKIQVAIGKKIIAKSILKPIRKNVLAKCYGGDVTRKKKLIEKQKKGKLKLKKHGKMAIPKESLKYIVNIKK